MGIERGDDEKINKHWKQILALLMNIFIYRSQTYSTQSDCVERQMPENCVSDENTLAWMLSYG